ncbi:IS701 family transposase [Streptomyces sp. NPDC096538]|uniref:IS701 family transposase n=1 Tax=Streptomyces sp. NPDC096538 TaxID=3155427 RepID=UPI003327A666
MEGITEVSCWAAELESVFARVAGRFARADLRWRMRDYVRGLLGHAARKNGWQLAEWAGHRTPDGFQRLLNSSVWDADAPRDDVRAYVAERLGPDGALIIDDTGFIKKGTTSAGVGRQYTGTSGKIDNCQIGVCAAYTTRSGRALMDRELYQPKAWTSDRDRCRAAKIPDERGFATKGEPARDIVRRCLAAGLPATWVTADEAYGQDWHFRRLLEQLDVGYVVTVPKSQQIKSLAGIWRIDQLIEDAPADAWQRLSCGGGAEGPRVYDWAAAKLPANLIFDPDPPTHHRWVMARRSISDPGEPASPRLRTRGCRDRRAGPGGRLPLDDRGVLPGREEQNPETPGRSPAPPTSRPRPRHPRTELVGLEKTPPSRRPPLPLPKTQLRTRSAAGVLSRRPRSSRHSGMVWTIPRRRR